MRQQEQSIPVMKEKIPDLVNLLMESEIFWEKKFFFEGNPKLLVYLVIYGCYGVSQPASSKKNKTVMLYSAVED